MYEILLNLHKAYDALEPDLYLDTLAVYGVGPRSLCLVYKYWDRLTMVERAGGYFGAPFKGYHRMTQVGPLFTTILNVVVYAVLQHWITMVA